MQVPHFEAAGTTMALKVGITSSEYVSKICDLLPSNEGRQSLIYWLVRSYGITDKCDKITIRRCHPLEMKRFHDADFVDILCQKRPTLDQLVDECNDLIRMKNYDNKPKGHCHTNVSDEDEDSSFEDDRDSLLEALLLEDELDPAQLEQYGLLHDCPVFPLMAEYVQLIAGSTVSTANYVVREHERGNRAIGINWYGGRHHSHKDKAAGFCYVNDIVLGINQLRMTFPKVFYLDLDLHHGDGVEAAFKFSSKVVTCSVHRYDVGFFPGTGGDTVRSKYINVPTRRGLDDLGLRYILDKIVMPCLQAVCPAVLVLQLGSDGLALDPHKEWNFTIEGFANNVLHFLLAANCPTMIVGGGGYNHTETAKFCTYLTGRLLNQAVDYQEVPEHPLLDQYQDEGYRFWTDDNTKPARMANKNDGHYLEYLREKVLSNFNP